MTRPLLRVSDFSVTFESGRGPVPAVRGVDLAIEAGEIVGIAGESGSGKSTLCTGLVRALPAAARIGGRVHLDGRSLYDLPERDFAPMRGRDLAMVLQNPMTSLDPLFTIGSQVREVLARRGVARGDLHRAALDALARVHITAPELRAEQYPHQLSGGMRQRVLIAMAASGAPRLLVADEPTSALDASIQDEILLLFRELRDATGAAVVIVTHELEVIRRVCDRVVIMYAGRVVEEGPVGEVLAAPRHPYTRALLAATPRIEGDEIVLTPIPGQVPDVRALGEGCAFAERCAHAARDCARPGPAWQQVGPGHRSLCHPRGLAA